MTLAMLLAILHSAAGQEFSLCNHHQQWAKQSIGHTAAVSAVRLIPVQPGEHVAPGVLVMQSMLVRYH